MAQLNWTYVSDAGKRFNVGIYHGSRTGHLVVYCNLKVVLIDFNVLQTKTYPLFLDDELCELTVERKNDRFYYGFEINEQADTPRNRQRKAQERKHWRQAIAFLGVLGICVSLFAAFFVRFGDRQQARQRTALLASQGENTVARIDEISGAGDEALLRFSFVAEGEAHTGKVVHPGPQPVIPEHGMPLQSGDEVTVRYVRGSPETWELQLDKPSEAQVQAYREMALRRHLELHPEQTTAYAECLLNIAQDIGGPNGLANFYFQESSPERNPQANSLRYKRLVRSLDFQERAERECW